MHEQLLQETRQLAHLNRCEGVTLRRRMFSHMIDARCYAKPSDIDRRRVTMQSILVPLDGSVLAERSLPYARILALALGARVRLLRVIVDMPGNDMVAESIA